MLRATTACTFSTSEGQKVVRTPQFLHFWLGNVLRATTACNFSSLIWPDGSAPAASEPQIIGKTQWIATFLPIPRTCIFFLLTLSLLCSSHFFASPPWLFAPLHFHLSILSEVWLQNFLRSSTASCINAYKPTPERESIPSTILTVCCRKPSSSKSKSSTLTRPGVRKLLDYQSHMVRHGESIPEKHTKKRLHL